MTQRYLPVVQRLEEVNAYGSDALITVLHRYKQSAPRHEETAETPSVRAYTEWAEAAEDVLYLLRQVQDAADAEETALTLPLAVEHLQQCRLRALSLGSAPDAAARRSAAVKTLPRLRAELHTEHTRLLENHAFGTPALLPMSNRRNEQRNEGESWKLASCRRRPKDRAPVGRARSKCRVRRAARGGLFYVLLTARRL